MEGVWFKTEPNDDTFEDSFTIKLEQDVTEPLTIIGQKESEIVHVRPNDGSKKSKQKSPRQQKQHVVESDTRKVDKKSGPKKLKTGRKVGRPPGCVKQSHICDECGKEFRGSYNLNRHKLVHSDVRPFICTVENCGAAFRQNSALKSHQMSHTGERKYFCEECGQGFLSRFHMTIHQRTKHGDECPYVCKECGQAFARKKGLIKHELEHRGEKPFECDDCGMRFFEKILLKSHKKTHTVDGKPFICAECGKGFYHKTSLNAHQRNHSTVRPFGCECGKRFTQKGTLTIHKMIHNDVKPFGCEVCGLRFTQKFTLKTHRLKQHGLSTTSEKQYKPRLSVAAADPKSQNVQASETSESCAPVSVDSSQISIVRLNENDSVELEQPTNEIGNCSPTSQSERSALDDEFPPEADGSDSTEFEDKFTINLGVDAQEPQPIDEMQTNLDQIKEEPRSTEPVLEILESERTTTYDVSDNRINKEPAAKKALGESVKLPFPCEKCDRTFALVSALKNHQRSHQVRKKLSFICEECGKIFAVKQQLKIHKRSHLGFTPYSCTECDKRFTTRGNLKTHQLIHTGERPFGCETCGMTFSVKKSLDRHKLVHTDEKRFECDACGMKFRESGGLKRHILTHTGERNYGCDICGKTFVDKTYIKFHLRTHTGYKPFGCDQCSSAFISKCQLKQHKAHVHRGVGEPSPYQRLKLRKIMKMVNNSM